MAGGRAGCCGSETDAYTHPPTHPPQAPPPVEEDKVYTQPCFTTQCNLGTVARKGPNGPCPKTDTERVKAAAPKAAAA